MYGHIVEATGKGPKRVCPVRRPIVKGVLLPVLQPIIILATILTQRFNASLTPIAIDPSASEHATSNINAIQNVGLRYGNRLNTERRQRLDTRPATAPLP